MATLTIDCFLTESQMNKIVKAIDRYLDREDRDSLSFEDTIEGVTVYVDFDVFFTVKLGEVDILNENGDRLDNDSAVLKDRLYKVVEEYNTSYEQSQQYHNDILEDQRNWVMN